MMIGNRKKKEEYARSINRSLEKARRPVRIDWQQFSTENNQAKSVLGFEPSSLRQNAIALPLALPPRPFLFLIS